MVRIVNNIAGIAICFFVPATHFFVSTMNTLHNGTVTSRDSIDSRYSKIYKEIGRSLKSKGRWVKISQVGHFKIDGLSFH